VKYCLLRFGGAPRFGPLEKMSPILSVLSIFQVRNIDIVSIFKSWYRRLTSVNAVLRHRVYQWSSSYDATRKLTMTPPILLPVGHRSCALGTSADDDSRSYYTWPIGQLVKRTHSGPRISHWAIIMSWHGSPAIAAPELSLLLRCTLTLSWWCSGSASDSWSKGRWFDSRLGRYQVN